MFTGRLKQLFMPHWQRSKLRGQTKADFSQKVNTYQAKQKRKDKGNGHLSDFKQPAAARTMH
jgi:hypothetical protein